MSGGPSAGGPVTLGIDVGGTKMLGLALDAAGRTLFEVRAPSPQLPRGAGPTEMQAASEALVEAMAVLATQLGDELERAGLGPAAAIGVGVPGLVDATGTLHYAPNLPAGTGLAVAEVLQHRLARRVVVDNDATCAAVAESTLGAAAGTGEALVVTLGTGIGGGLVSHGQVWRGANGFAGEIGHMVVDPGGPVCSCGKRGCWERFASGSGLARLAREAAQAGRLHAVVDLAGGDPEAVRGEHVTAAALGGDTEAHAVLEELGWWLALGLSNLALALDPEVVVLGGGLVEVIAIVLGTVRHAFNSMLVGQQHRPEVRIVPAALGEHAGAIGAALVARDER
ncbi:MAG: ROK family protein [Acidimicrobiales bacterium]